MHAYLSVEIHSFIALKTKDFELICHNKNIVTHACVSIQNSHLCDSVYTKNHLSEACTVID